MALLLLAKTNTTDFVLNSVMSKYGSFMLCWCYPVILEVLIELFIEVSDCGTQVLIVVERTA